MPLLVTGGAAAAGEWSRVEPTGLTGKHPSSFRQPEWPHGVHHTPPHCMSTLTSHTLTHTHTHSMEQMWVWPIIVETHLYIQQPSEAPPPTHTHTHTCIHTQTHTHTHTHTPLSLKMESPHDSPQPTTVWGTVHGPQPQPPDSTGAHQSMQATL